MPFQHYFEFSKNVPATHPKTGDSLPQTVVDIYAYPDRFEIRGYGTLDTIRPEGGVTPDRIEQVKQVMRVQGFRMLREEPLRGVRHSRSAAALSR